MSRIIEGKLPAEEREAIRSRMERAAELEREGRLFKQKVQDEAIMRAAEAEGLLRPLEEQP